jgi:protein TonB
MARALSIALADAHDVKLVQPAGMTAATPHGPLSGFMINDRMTSVVWAAAVSLAIVVHSTAFVVAAATPKTPKPPPITMAISVPPELPPPPPAPPPEPPQPKKAEPIPDVAPPPAPPAPPSDTPPPPDAPPPQASEQVVALGPSTGQGVAVAVGTPDGVAGAPPPASSGPARTDVPVTNRAQSGPPAENWSESGYKSGAFDRMNKNKRYPRQAEVMGLEGRCMVVIKLNHDGSLAEKPKVFGKGTGHALLDEECVAMAERTAFPPIPVTVDAPVTFRIPIEFHLVNR